MRHGRRGGHGGMEFGGSGEDSFVAVVVTKLTGALLFILLLTMVIMALIPRAERTSRPRAAEPSTELTITTPEVLPDAIAGRPYQVALAARGGADRLRWSVEGTLPEGLKLDEDAGRIEGTPRDGTSEPVALRVSVTDGSSRATTTTRLLVFRPSQPLFAGSWTPRAAIVPMRAWLERGFGFLVLLLVHSVGMNTLRNLERSRAEGEGGDPAPNTRRRFAIYRITARLGTLAAAGALAAWMILGHTA